MNKILIFTATYNEVLNIDILLDKINKYSQNADILIVDDNSSDGTIKVLKKFEQQYKNINLIIRQKKLGLNTAHKVGYNYAIKNNYDYFITLDADLSHDPKIIKGAHGTINLNAKPIPDVSFNPNDVPKVDSKQLKKPVVNESNKDTAA